MLRAALYLIPYALVAAMSPLAFAATLAVIGSGRLKALGFGFGFVLGQVAACSLLVLIGTAAVPHRRSDHPKFQALLEVGLGVGLLWLAMVVRRRPPAASQTSTSRTKAALERLARMHATTTVAAGLLLGIGGPKRLVLTALASASITASVTNVSREVPLVVWYSMLATALVWGPVLVFMLLGTRAVDELDGGRRWLAEHRREVGFYPLVLVGTLLVVVGAVSALVEM